MGALVDSGAVGEDDLIGWHCITPFPLPKVLKLNVTSGESEGDVLLQSTE